MVIHTSIVNMPIEVILDIFSMFRDIGDIVKFAYSNNYVFNIYKNNFDKICNILITNNETNCFVNYVIIACIGLVPSDNIETKLSNMKLLEEFLSKHNNQELLQINYSLNHYYNVYTNDKLNIDIIKRPLAYYHYRIIYKRPHEYSKIASNLSTEQFELFNTLIKSGYDINTSSRAAIRLNNQQIQLMKQLLERDIKLNNAIDIASNINNDDLESFFGLIERNISTYNAVKIINDFDEIQTGKMEELITSEIDPDQAVELVDDFDDEEIELIVQIFKITKSKHIVDNIIECKRDATDLAVMLKLVKHDFDVNEVGYITSRIVDNNFTEEQFNKVIEMKKKGISEDCIIELIDKENFDEFNFDYYDSLMTKINDKDIVNNIIINQTNENDINKIIELINEAFPKNHIYHLVDNNFSKEQCNNIKPFLEYIQYSLDINDIIHNFERDKHCIKILQDNNFNNKTIAMFLLEQKYHNGIKLFIIIDDIIRIFKELQKFELNDDFIFNFVINFRAQFTTNTTFVSHTDIDHQPQAKRQKLNDNIYESPQYDACIMMIKKGFRKINTIIYCVNLMYENNIDTKYIQNLNDEESKFLDTCDNTKIKIYLNLCKEGLENNLVLIKSVSNEMLTKIDNYASNTGKNYVNSMKHFVEQFHANKN